ncbi:unnamed protein product, partial [Amoebophrya sp. A25]
LYNYLITQNPCKCNYAKEHNFLKAMGGRFLHQSENRTIDYRSISPNVLESQALCTFNLLQDIASQPSSPVKLPKHIP